MNSKSLTDWYKILGVVQTASLKDITKAYRTLAKTKHPDKCPNDPNAKEKFIQLKQAFDFLKDDSKRRQFDNERAQVNRDQQRYAAFSQQYNHMAGPKGVFTARTDDEEWEALNRGEAYYGQWMKNKFAAQQAAKQTGKQRAQKYRQDLLNEWKNDQKSKYQRTMARLKLMLDPSCRMNPQHLQNFLWAMNVDIPRGAPPGVAIAEFHSARQALAAERLCNKYKPVPIRFEWLTPRPQTNFQPPNSYFDADEKKKKETKMNPNLEPEQDVGFGVGKKPMSFADDEVIILNEMGTSFGTKKNPIVIDDEPKNSTPTADESIIIDDDTQKDFTKDDDDLMNMFGSKKVEKPKAPSTSNDDEDLVAQFRAKQKARRAAKRPASPLDKTKQNQRLFESLIFEPQSTKKTSKKSSQEVDKDFAAELRKIKLQKEKEKMDKERAEELARKAREEKIKQNADLFHRASNDFNQQPRKSKKSSRDIRPDFLEELKRQKAAKIAEARIAQEQAKPKEPPKSKERIKLDKIAEHKDIKNLDKIDMKLLFSQKW